MTQKLSYVTLNILSFSDDLKTIEFLIMTYRLLQPFLLQKWRFFVTKIKIITLSLKKKKSSCDWEDGRLISIFMKMKN